MLLIDRLKNNTNLSVNEKSVADYILKNPKVVLKLTADELASLTFTSASTVGRLCKKLDLTGYAELKIKLASEVNSFFLTEQRIELNKPFYSKDKSIDIAKNMLNLHYQSLTDTFNEIDINQLERLALQISKADHILILGTGQSLIISEDFNYRFSRIGFKTYVLNPSSIAPQSLKAYGENDIALIISYTGNTQDCIVMSKILKAHKIPIILLTGAKQSKIGAMADEVLYCSADEAANKIGSFASRTSMIFVLDCIYSLIFSMNYEKNIVSLNKYSLMIKDFRSKN